MQTDFFGRGTRVRHATEILLVRYPLRLGCGDVVDSRVESTVHGWLEKAYGRDTLVLAKQDRTMHSARHCDARSHDAESKANVRPPTYGRHARGR